MIKKLSLFAIRHGLIPVAYLLLRAYLMTVRIRVVGEEQNVARLRRGEKCIAAFWHQRILLVIRYAPRFSAFSPAVMISQSRDGDLASDIIRQLNFRPVRGSSSRGGREALAAIVADLSSHPLAVHAVDGPRGPAGTIKAGIIRMAQLSGVPIVPVYASADRAWVLRSWDRFLIPRPFSTVWVRWGDPLPVPRELSEGHFEQLRRDLEKEMRKNQHQDDGERGWPSPLL